MSDYKMNPRHPFKIRCPNKIRKRIILARELDRLDDSVVPATMSRLKSMFMRAMLNRKK